MRILGKILAVHSFKGGTGKTLISTNLAATCASQGKNICLLDLDFRAPSLYVLFKESRSKFWLNDFISGKCEIDDAITDVTKKYGTVGKLFAGLANPSTGAIQEMLIGSRKGEMTALRRLLSLSKTLLEKRGFDYVILDTSPGLQYSSMNAVVASDVTLIVSVNDEMDIDGTRRMVRNFYEAFEKKSFILVNKILCDSEYTPAEKVRLLSRFEKTSEVPLLGIMPLYCDVLRSDRSTIFALEKPDHPFTKIIGTFAKHL